MQCNCQQETEQRLTQHYAKRLPDAKGVQAQLQGYGFGITEDNSVVTRAYMPVRVEYSELVKKTGQWKPKKQMVNMHFSFCPFCGTKAQADSAVEKTAA